MTSTELLGLITLGILLIAVLLAVFAFVVPTNNKTGNRLIAAYLLILAITISVFFYHPYYSPPLVIEKLRDDINLFSAPLFYLFVLSVLYRDFKLQWKHLWHIGPFVLNFLLFVPRFYAVPELQRKEYFYDYFAHWEPHASSVIALTQALFYLAITFVVLVRYRKVLHENYADASAVHHRWLWQTNILLSVLFAFSLFKSVFKRLTDNYELVIWVRIGMVSLLLAFLSWLLLKILLHPTLFRGVDSRLLPLSNPPNLGATAGADQLVKTNEDQQIEQLRNFMSERQPFLNPTLTVKELADQLGWPDRELSVLINQKLDRHFFDFVNDYRIDHARQLLKDKDNEKMTVLEILYAVGFNSKSSFNVAFKNRTGMTPTEYRKN
ncbi:MAG: helix-turn-helix transcriptional regulator [Bacteroidota bacterium]